MYGMGVGRRRLQQRRLPDILITCVGQNRLSENSGNGTFADVTKSSGLFGRQGFSTSAMWFDYDRDGLLDLFICNYVRWAPDHDVFCSLDGKQKSYCTPEAYRGDTCWLISQPRVTELSKMSQPPAAYSTVVPNLSVSPCLTYEQDGWPDLVVANDTQPNKLYKNLHNGKFKDVRVEAGLAFSQRRASARRHGHRYRRLRKFRQARRRDHQILTTKWSASIARPARQF